MMNLTATSHVTNTDAKFANTSTLQLKVCMNHKTVTPGNHSRISANVVYLFHCQRALRHNILEKQVELQIPT